MIGTSAAGETIRDYAGWVLGRVAHDVTAEASALPFAPPGRFFELLLDTAMAADREHLRQLGMAFPLMRWAVETFRDERGGYALLFEVARGHTGICEACLLLICVHRDACQTAPISPPKDAAGTIPSRGCGCLRRYRVPDTGPVFLAAARSCAAGCGLPAADGDTFCPACGSAADRTAWLG